MEKMKHTLSRRVRFKPGTCPTCRHVLRTGRYLDGSPKRAEGDFVVCLCGEILVLDADLQPVPALAEDFARTHPDVLRDLKIASDIMREKHGAS